MPDETTTREEITYNGVPLVLEADVHVVAKVGPFTLRTPIPVTVVAAPPGCLDLLLDLTVLDGVIEAAQREGITLTGESRGGR